MSKLVAALVLGLVLHGTAAQAESATRFTHGKSGYLVSTSSHKNGWVYAGINPNSGKSFSLLVSPKGSVSGTWEGKPLNFALSAQGKQLLKFAAARGR